jgi:SAM-dependent methyltransferase
MPRASDRFRIAGDLLAGSHGDGRWNNFGHWAEARNYSEAARALARLHGDAAALAPEMRVLELACGFGAGLDLWRTEFGVRSLSVLELREECLRILRARPDASQLRLVQGRFDEPLAGRFGDAGFDAILCVDAAYHARSLPALLAASAPLLAPGGVIVFSTLVQGSGYGGVGPMRRAMLRWALSLASVPAGSVLDRRTVLSCIDAAGLSGDSLRDLTGEVFTGFAAWVAKRHLELQPSQRRSGAWRKIRLAAQMCRSLASTRRLEYVLVVSRRKAGAPA